MKLSELLLDSQPHREIASRIYGVVVGIVTNNEDPEGLGRVKVQFPWLSDEDESNWVRIATPMAGTERGIYFLPEVDDEVLVVFEHGDLRFPYIIGSLWNGQDKPPVTNDNGKNNLRVIKSRSGHVIRLNDEEGKETIEIIDKTKKNSIVIDTAANSITITADGDITLSAGTIKLEAQNIEIKSEADTKVEASAGMDLQASSTMNLQGQTINLN
ncbi:MAG: phage baseplate assembly protein V [Xenococcus sp. (in: cyanobacteria)]